jgi:hypothetical protein
MSVRTSKTQMWMVVFAAATVTLACSLIPPPPPPPTRPQPTDTSPSPSRPRPTNTPPPPSPTPFHPSIEIVGEEELVYDWTTDRCPEGGAPDLPVRAFRDADGMVQINLSSPINLRMIGEDLDSLRVDCGGTLSSDMDPDPAHFNYSEWMGSTYTLDGETVYALIHNEFYGSQTSHWYALRDFGSIQGEHDWHYQSWDGSAYTDMWFDADNDRWQGSQPLCQAGRGWAHPDAGCEPTRTWVSPVAGTVTVSGSVSDADPNGGDGVIVRILKGSDELWSATVENGDPEKHTFNLEVDVVEGDAIHFRVNHRGNTNNDTTYLNPKINVGPDPCPSGEHDRCLMFSITFAQSTDGGKTFTQPPGPDHLVASLPYRYEPDWGMQGIWQPSNIVKSPKDGYNYALIQVDINRPGERWIQGTCVMRTKTLDDPKSWRAWDGEGFNMRFINPYEEPDADPEEHMCEFVPVSDTGALSYNLTYNTYFDTFMAVGQDVNEPIPGFYYALSDDLVHWTRKQLLMATDLAQTTDGPFLAYPSLVDPDSPSRSFDVTGQNPYLYYSRFQSFSLIDVDLLRVRVQLSK